jgi:hypothetical protein
MLLAMKFFNMLTDLSSCEKIGSMSDILPPIGLDTFHDANLSVVANCNGPEFPSIGWTARLFEFKLATLSAVAASWGFDRDL